ncbi:DUF2809 domain-containing protein [Actinoplanes sp. NPDC049316]|uniref:ribosomal maturation YjgA family protein n=1 Tax=Actinoplanes sp. NPDC049316 TaxID=3154727 RepID=UPI00343B8182
MHGRLVALGSAGLILGLGLAVRALAGGPFAQNAGTALYASMIYAGVLVLRPTIAPLPTGVVAVAFCWLVEAFQLTGLPAALSERSLIARLVLGSHFDWVDVAWYPAGVVPLVVAHLLVRARTSATAGPG